MTVSGSANINMGRARLERQKRKQKPRRCLCVVQADSTGIAASLEDASKGSYLAQENGWFAVEVSWVSGDPAIGLTPPTRLPSASAVSRKMDLELATVTWKVCCISRFPHHFN